MEEIAIHTAEFDGYKWYSLSQFCKLVGKHPETIRLWTKGSEPRAIRDRSRGVLLYRLADGFTVLRAEVASPNVAEPELETEAAAESQQGAESESSEE